MITGRTITEAAETLRWGRREQWVAYPGGEQQQPGAVVIVEPGAVVELVAFFEQSAAEFEQPTAGFEQPDPIFEQRAPVVFEPGAVFEQRDPVVVLQPAIAGGGGGGTPRGQTRRARGIALAISFGKWPALILFSSS